MAEEPNAADAVGELVARYFVARDTGRELTLDELCRGTPELRKHVAYAIAESLRMDDLLAGGAGDGPPPAPPRGVPGRFALLHRADAGGMGEVFHATDLEAGRAVAYKVLRAELDLPLFRDFFLNEARLTAALAHPAIVPVYAVVPDGCGRPAYAMEFIAGETLYDAIERRRAAPNAAAAPGLRTLLGHVVAVGLVVSHAHANGITHGDIKTNNVRVRTDGKPFVIDWGLARRHPDGVPAEALAADVAKLARLLDHVLDEDGVPPALEATRTAALAGRYATADALGDAVQQWLDTGGTPDYRDFWTVRAVRWANHRPAAATAVAAGLLLAFAATAAIVLYRAEQEEARATEVAKALEQAEKEKGLLQEIVRGSEAEAAAVRDIIAQAEVLGRFQASVIGGRRQLDIARGHLTQLATLAEKDPTRSGGAADLLRRCGKLAFTLGDLPQAATDYDGARRFAAEAFRADAGPANRLRFAGVLREWGVTRAVQWQIDAAKPAWNEAMQLLQPLAATDAAARFVLAQLHMVRGNVAARTEATEAARDEYAAARRRLDGLLAESPDKFEYRFALAEVLNNGSRLSGGDDGAREADCRRALAIWRGLVAEQPDRPETKAFEAAGLNHLGNALAVLGPEQADQAREAYRESVRIYKALTVAFPGVASNRSELADVETNLRRLDDRPANGKR